MHHLRFSISVLPLETPLVSIVTFEVESWAIAKIDLSNGKKKMGKSHASRPNFAWWPPSKLTAVEHQWLCFAALWLLRGKLSLVISFLTPGSSLIWREMLVKKQFLHTHTYCPAKLVNIGFFHLKFLTWLEVRPPQHFFVPFPLILCHYFCHPRWLLREKTVY